MRQPFFMPPQRMMPQMPIAPRFPMYAPYMMRPPMNPVPMNTMPPIPQVPQVPPQIPGVAAAATAAAGAPRLEGLLAGANSLFENAQKFTPYIQQATPMFKNLPALWRLYRGFKGSSTPDPLESSTIVAPVERPPRQPRRARQQTQQYVPITPKPSVPMIFQPPFE